MNPAFAGAEILKLDEFVMAEVKLPKPCLAIFSSRGSISDVSFPVTSTGRARDLGFGTIRSFGAKRRGVGDGRYGEHEFSASRAVFQRFQKPREILAIADLSESGISRYFF